MGDINFSSAGDYYDRLTGVPALAQQAMFRFDAVTMQINETPQRVAATAATPSLFRLLGIAPAHGRWFHDEEGETGNERKVILSDGLWRQLYGGDPSTVGRDIRLNGRSYTITGVMPPGFTFVNSDARLWIPLAFTPEQKRGHHSNNWYHVARLAPGAAIGQVQAQVNAVNAANLEKFPQMKQVIVNTGFYTAVEPLRDVLVRDVKPALYLLWGGAALVLLLAVLNITNLVLARLQSKRKDLATRVALGASTQRVIRQSVAEHLLLALAGAVGGIAVAAAILWALATVGIDRLPRANEVRLDVFTVAAVLAIAAVIGVIMGVLPAFQLSSLDVNHALREESRTGTGSRRSRLTRQALVIAQVSLAFVLLCGAGLLLESFRQLLAVDPGFRPGAVLTASTNAPSSRYAGDAEIRGLMRRSLEALAAVPGVTAVGATNIIPFGGTYNDSVIIPEGYVRKPDESVVSPYQVIVTPGYMEAMGIHLVHGRAFETRDDELRLPAVIVDERLAARFWPGADPLGRRMYTPDGPDEVAGPGPNTRWMTVVGVARTVRMADLSGQTQRPGAYYLPYAQRPSRGFTFAIRGGTVESVRRQFAAIDPELALFDVRPMAERIELSLAARKTTLLLAAGFGALALFLSTVGLYAVLAYLVAQRNREFGIRIAVGASPVRIIRLVLGEGGRLAAAGLAIGAAGLFALRATLQHQIYGVGPMDPRVLGAVFALVAAVALAASLLPARRAANVNPAVTLGGQ